MSDSLLTAVITTIQSPTASVIQLAEVLSAIQSKLVVVGDQKGPISYEVRSVEFLSLASQLESEFQLARKLPTGHYARKNIGYLCALSAGARCIYETDDDNAPLPHWAPRYEQTEAVIVAEKGWVNVYRHFSNDRIWPRGFLIDSLTESFRRAPVSAELVSVQAPIQQGLANNSPDVDAIWRLVLDKPFNFEDGPSIALAPGSWCPFNSQSTWWFPDVYPLMYLPSHCSFRMTDIWRSFIAQRCLWELKVGVVFHAAEVVQERNEHNLLRDFADEIPGYLRNRELTEILEKLPLDKGVDSVAPNLQRCYEVLVTAGFFPPEELLLLSAWLEDLARVPFHMSEPAGELIPTMDAR